MGLDSLMIFRILKIKYKMSIQLGFYFFQLHSYHECIEQCALLLSKNAFDKVS